MESGSICKEVDSGMLLLCAHAGHNRYSEKCVHPEIRMEQTYKHINEFARHDPVVTK